MLPSALLTLLFDLLTLIFFNKFLCVESLYYFAIFEQITTILVNSNILASCVLFPVLFNFLSEFLAYSFDNNGFMLKTARNLLSKAFSDHKVLDLSYECEPVRKMMFANFAIPESLSTSIT